MPSLPEVKAPEVPAPAAETATKAASKYQDFDFSSFGNLSEYTKPVPRKAVEKAAEKAPDAPAVELPKFEAPKFEMPNVEAPKFEAPQFDMPKVEVPKVEVPAPVAEAPKAVEAPAPAPAVEAAPEPIVAPAPAAEAPAAPDAPAGDLELPSLPELPKVDLPDVGGAIGDVFGKVKGAVDAQVGSVTDAMDAQVGAVKGSAEASKAAAAAAKAAADAQRAAFQASVDAEIGKVIKAIDTAVVETGNQINAAGEQLAALLPPEVQGAAKAAGGAVSGAVGAVQALPNGNLLLASLAVFTPTYLWYQGNLAGFAGRMSPKKTLRLMQRGEAFLVDIRDDGLRERSGIPLLKKTARQMAFALPREPLNADIAAKVGSRGELERQIQACRIANVKGVSRSIPVVVLGPNDAEAVAVARALRREGLGRPYVLRGGLAEWRSSGFDIAEGKIKYEGGTGTLTGTVRVLADEVEETVTEAQEALKDPQVAAVTALALAAAGYAAYDYKSTLEFVGVLGLQLTVVARVTGYQSLDDFFKDLQAVADAFNKVSQGASKVAAKIPLKRGSQ